MKTKTLLILMTVFLLPWPTHAATVLPEDLNAGDLIRGQSFNTVYYYGEDGLRYIFPNDKTYFTWYENFDDVKWLSDSDLSTIQIGGNVTYKPGVKMVKIQSDPTVYAIGVGGVLHAIETETLAQELYGSDWNTKIDDLPDGFFTNYTLGNNIGFASQYDPDVETSDALSINDDKDLRPATVISVTDDGYDPSTVTITSGRAVRWENTGSENHSVTEFDRTWGSGTLKPGEHYTRYFSETGTWTYYSTYDEITSVTGALIVE